MDSVDGLFAGLSSMRLELLVHAVCLVDHVPVLLVFPYLHLLQYLFNVIA